MVQVHNWLSSVILLLNTMRYLFLHLLLFNNDICVHVCVMDGCVHNYSGARFTDDVLRFIRTKVKMS